MESQSFDRQTLLNSLVKSNHGKLEEYTKIGFLAAKKDPEFLAHLISWNLIKGEIRDTKRVLPIVALRDLDSSDLDLAENAVANLMLLSPRELVKAYEYNKSLSAQGKVISGGWRRLFEKGLKLYIENQEANSGRWTATAVQHRNTLKTLYAISHTKPSELAQAVLFDKAYPSGSVFEKIAQLKDMTSLEAAGTILNFKIPFQIAIGALGKKTEEYEKNPEFVLALMEKMSGQQLLNNTKMLESFGVFKSNVLKSEYNKALERAKSDKKVSTLKAGKVIEVLKQSDPENAIVKELTAKLESFQETKISQNCSIDGDWVVLGDKSGSMDQAIELAAQISSLITKSVKGKVHLIFFDTDPTYIDATGMTLEQIKDKTKRIRADGCTSCGCGLSYLQSKKLNVNGIAIVSDGGDNRAPKFEDAYASYSKFLDYNPPVYYFLVGNVGRNRKDPMTIACEHKGIELTTFDLRNQKVDYYSLPNMIKQLKTVKYSLLDEIMDTPLLTLKDVFKV